MAIGYIYVAVSGLDVGERCYGSTQRMEGVEIMNEPIISPWIFYLAYLAKMSFVLLIAAVTIIVTCSVAIDGAKREVSTQRESVEELGYEAQKYNHLLKLCPSNGEFIVQVQEFTDKHSKGMEKLGEAVDNLEYVKAKARLWSTLAVALIGLWVVIPSEATIYRMVVAQHVTPHNLQVTGETIEAVIDKTVDKILKAKEGE